MDRLKKTDLKKVHVLCHGRRVGTMALHQRYFAAFEYDRDWLADGFSISPRSLPLEQKVFLPKMDPFDGIFGVNRWCLSPAYDLTYSNSLGGEHATTVHGNGADPGMPELLAAAKSIGIREQWARAVARDIEECVHARLAGSLK